MNYDPNLHNRNSIRLQGYDYSQPGAYFITINTHNKIHQFGWIMNGYMKFSEIGKIVQEQWLEIPLHFKKVLLDDFIIMPNHMHAIVVIEDGNKSQRCKGEALGFSESKTTMGNPLTTLGNETGILSPNASPNQHPIGTTPGSLSAIIQNFKSVTTRKINKELETPGAMLWQRNFYEHIIRDEEDYDRIVEYIRDNPNRWEDTAR
jgi:REP element-mobilizing transposase RayT